jgi:NAD(P)-dependent dehydrogenase (short-subunit alcohol dehydrogenase family)
VVAEIGSFEGDGHFIHVEVNDSDSVQRLVKESVEILGGLDVVVNNAGYGTAGKLLDTEESEWAKMMSVNLTGTFLVSKYALPHLLEQDQSCIINMSSVAGMVGVRDRAAYCTTKGGVIAFTKAVALDYVDQGLRVNAICPGTVDTPWVGRMISQYPDPEAARAAMVARQPMGRLGMPAEIAQAAVYLASNDAGFITGTSFVIDGGLTMQ